MPGNLWQNNPMQGLLPSEARSQERQPDVALIVGRRILFRDCIIKSLEKHFLEMQFHGVDTIDDACAIDGMFYLTILGTEEMSDENKGDFYREIGVLAEQHRAKPIIVIVEHLSEDVFHSLDSLDVAGIIPGNSSIEVMAAALRFALVGGTFRPAQEVRASGMTKPFVAQGRPEREGREIEDGSTSKIREIFTKREMEVVEKLRDGAQNKIIAHELNMSESTVKVHLRSIMKKLNASNRTQVALLTRRLFP